MTMGLPIKSQHSFLKYWVRCIALKILATEAGGPSDQTGVVTFHAKLLINGKRMLHWEKSRFVREQDRWVYLDGETK